MKSLCLLPQALLLSLFLLVECRKRSTRSNRREIKKEIRIKGYSHVSKTLQGRENRRTALGDESAVKVDRSEDFRSELWYLTDEENQLLAR